MLAEVVYALTACCAVVVVVTRLRLRGDGPDSGRARVGRTTLAVHTTLGLGGVVLWGAYLVASADTTAGGPLVGVLGLGCWWVTGLAGLLIAARWKPTRRGRHVVARERASWTRGPLVSALAHLLVAVSAVVFTWAYLSVAV